MKNTDNRIESIAAATLLQAAKDYFRTKNPNKQKAILKDLRSDWMLMLTDGQSAVVAEKLQTNADEIRKRMKILH